jgi:patatin-like phospholipase/acyl hydrolase
MLSIDGGGIRGILPAAILAQIEERFLGGKSIGDYFDLITGTSTGGIIALGLATGNTAKDILSLYLGYGSEIFPPLKRDYLNLRASFRFVRSLRHYSYSACALHRHLKDFFGDRILGEAQRRLCIPSFDGFTEVYIFKTPHHPDYKVDWREQMLTAAMATASAPTYLPVYKDRGRFFADGGVWANDPVMIGLVDTLVCHKLDRRQIHILSLGTGDTEIRISNQQVRLGGLWHWRDIIASAMHLQSQNALGQAGLLVGRDQLIRLNAPAMPENPIMLDDYKRAVLELPPIAERLVNEHAASIRDRFLFSPAEMYESFHGPRTSSV